MILRWRELSNRIKTCVNFHKRLLQNSCNKNKFIILYSVGLLHVIQINALIPDCQQREPAFLVALGNDNFDFISSIACHREIFFLLDFLDFNF